MHEETNCSDLSKGSRAALNDRGAVILKILEKIDMNVNGIGAGNPVTGYETRRM